MAYFLTLNQIPYQRFEVPKTDSQRPNNYSQSPQLDSQSLEIDFQRPEIDNQCPNSLYRGMDLQRLNTDSWRPKIYFQRSKNSLLDIQS